MICPNGNISLNRLISMVESDDFEVYFEPDDAPADWDFRNGIYRSPNRWIIDDKDDLMLAINKEANKEGTICYDVSNSYYKKHPYEGEEVSYIREEFFWEYSSPNGKKYCYKICPCTYLKGYEPKNIPLCLECFDSGFENTCFTIGTWERDKEGYEFRSVGSRMFDYICEEDLPIIWKAIKKADEYLNNRFRNEED